MLIPQRCKDCPESGRRRVFTWHQRRCGVGERFVNEGAACTADPQALRERAALLTVLAQQRDRA